MIDTVFFDWGGVIADDPGDDFLRNILRKYGANEQQIQEIHQRYMFQFMRGHITEHEYWRILKEEYGLSMPGDIQSVFASWEGFVTNPDVLQLIVDIKATGRHVALLSNVIVPTYAMLLQVGSYAPFDSVVVSCVEGYAKPELEIYEIALSRAGTTGERSLFIDDKQHNLTAAESLGFTTILAQNPAQFIAETRALLDL